MIADSLTRAACKVPSLENGDTVLGARISSFSNKNRAWESSDKVSHWRSIHDASSNSTRN